jgi:hypothetical protein
MATIQGLPSNRGNERLQVILLYAIVKVNVGLVGAIGLLWLARKKPLPQRKLSFGKSSMLAEVFN